MRSVCLQCEPQCSKNTLHIMMMWSLEAYQKCKQLETSLVTIHPEKNHPPSTIIGLVASVKSVSSTHIGCILDDRQVVLEFVASITAPRQGASFASGHLRRLRDEKWDFPTCGGCICMYTVCTFIHEIMRISGKWHNLYPESPKTKLCPMVVGNPLHELSQRAVLDCQGIHSYEL